MADIVFQNDLTVDIKVFKLWKLKPIYPFIFIVVLYFNLFSNKLVSLKCKYYNIVRCLISLKVEN